MRKRLAVVVCVLMFVLRTGAIEPAAGVVKDVFPAGTGTPEGAACDLARAFIHNDSALFLATCIEPYGSADTRQTRHQFLQSVVVQMKLDPTGSSPSPDSPKSIAKCFAARRFSKGMAVTGEAAAYGFQDVMFVDVSALLQNGTTQLCRTLVIKNKQGKWMVDPQPEIVPEVSTGLDDEAPSTQELPLPGSGK